MNILHVDSSITGDMSVTRELGSAIIDRLKNQNPDATVVYRDVCDPEVPHQSAAYMAYRAKAASGEADATDARLEKDAALADTLLEEFLVADVVVLGAPLYNLGIPSQLKSWIDYLAIPRKTFRYTETGSVGLCGGKKVYLASSQGGVYSSPEAKAMEHQESYLTAMFTFMGITDIQIVRADGVNISPEQRKASVEKALAEIEKL